MGFICTALLLWAACFTQAAAFDWLATLDRGANDVHLAAVEVGSVLYRINKIPRHNFEGIQDV